MLSPTRRTLAPLATNTPLQRPKAVTHQNEAELAVLVLPVALQVLANGHCIQYGEASATALGGTERLPGASASLERKRLGLKFSPAFLMRKYRSSGISGARPAPFRIRRTLLPVTLVTRGIPCWSRRKIPICEGVIPFLANLQIISCTSAGVVLHHLRTT